MEEYMEAATHMKKAASTFRVASHHMGSAQIVTFKFASHPRPLMVLKEPERFKSFTIFQPFQIVAVMFSLNHSETILLQSRKRLIQT